MRLRIPIWATAGFAFSAMMLAAGGVLVASASSASADIISDGGALTLDAAPGALADNTMAPGDHIYWPISAALNASTSGDLTLQILSSQALATDPGGLRLILASCPVAWTTSADPSVAPTCNRGSGTILIPDTAFASIAASETWNLGTMSSVSNLPMIATIWLPTNVPADLQGASATINFGFTADGDTENASPSDPRHPVLATTGTDPAGPVLLGLGLLLAGAILGRLRVLASRRDAESDDDAPVQA